MGKGKPGAVYEKFIDGSMRIVGSGADKDWVEPQAEAWDAMRNKVWGVNPLDKQEGGNHYKDMAIQPVEFITANNLGFLEGNVVKYICRHHAKNGAEDIKKAIHYCELLLQTKYGG
jgi:hypothetical protein